MTGYRPPVDGFGNGTSLDDLFAVFANYRRRCVLHYLREEERATLGGIARQIAAWECASRADSNAGSEQLVDRIEIDLFHRQLPRLRDAYLLEFDRRESLFVYRDPPDIVRALLDLSTDRDLPA